MKAIRLIIVVVLLFIVLFFIEKSKKNAVSQFKELDSMNIDSLELYEGFLHLKHRTTLYPENKILDTLFILTRKSLNTELGNYLARDTRRQITMIFYFEDEMLYAVLHKKDSESFFRVAENKYLGIRMRGDFKDAQLQNLLESIMD